MKRLNPEEQIRSRLRELTEETRRVREELQKMVRKDSSRPNPISDERIFKLKRRKREP